MARIDQLLLSNFLERKAVTFPFILHERRSRGTLKGSALLLILLQQKAMEGGRGDGGGQKKEGGEGAREGGKEGELMKEGEQEEKERREERQVQIQPTDGRGLGGNPTLASSLKPPFRPEAAADDPATPVSAGPLDTRDLPSRPVTASVPRAGQGPHHLLWQLYPESPCPHPCIPDLKRRERKWYIHTQALQG